MRPMPLPMRCKTPSRGCRQKPSLRSPRRHAAEARTFTPRGLERRMEEKPALSFRLQRRLARLWESGNLGWSLGALVVSLIAIAPLIAIATLAAHSSGDAWPHLIANVLPGALRTTLLLMLGVGTLTLVIGAGTAWLVTMYRFPGSRVLAWLLLLPLAMPTYIIAFCFLELFDYSGLLQTTLRSVFGWTSAKDYWFPDIRSLSGAIFFISAALPLCLCHGAGELPRPVGLRARSRPHARPKCHGDILGSCAAAGAACSRRRRCACAYGDAERYRRGLIFRRADANRRHLRHLARSQQSGRRGADRRRDVDLCFRAAPDRARLSRQTALPSHHRQVSAASGRRASRLSPCACQFGLRAAGADRVCASGRCPRSQRDRASGVGANCGFLGGRLAQPDARNDCRGRCRRLRLHPRLCRPADQVQADPRAERALEHQLRGARHGA